MVATNNIKDKNVKKLLNEVAYDAELVNIFTHLSEVSKGEMKYAEDAKTSLQSIIKY
ncbi:MAG: hypothetical protein IPK03_00055 [Bacteroidetes bacterium]|nr:hypothetical protein [Bacteroidota bacterium]